MKIIDILNKMANGELEDGFKFCFGDEVYTYTKNDNSIRDINFYKLGQRKVIEEYLNDEVLLFKDNNQEVIEENKEIEELQTKIISEDWTPFIIEHHNKINELVRAVNKLNNREKAEK